MEHLYGSNTWWKVDYAFIKEGEVHEADIMVHASSLAAAVFEAMTALGREADNFDWEKWTIWNAGITQEELFTAE